MAAPGEQAGRPRVVVAHPDPRDPGGITAVVSSLRDGGLDREVDLVELHTSAMGSPLPRKLAQALRAMARLVAMVAGPRRPDLVHLHVSTGASLIRKLGLAYICRRGRVPYIAHEHSGELEEWIGGSRPRRALARSLYGNAAVAIVLGEGWRELMAALGATRVEVVGNGLSAAERERLRDASRPAPPGPDAAPEQRPILLFYGRWSEKKGPDRLAAALRSLGRTDYELRLFGSGDRAWIESLFAGVPGRIRIEGWLDVDRKPGELAVATALVAPSRGEGFPVALVEARAAGTPIIATDVGAVSEALVDYERAELVPSGDEGALAGAIGRALDGDLGTPPPRKAPPELPDRLRAEHLAGHLAEIYRRVVGRC